MDILVTFQGIHILGALIFGYLPTVANFNDGAARSLSLFICGIFIFQMFYYATWH